MVKGPLAATSLAIVLCALLPLLSTTGRNFEYEYATAVALLLVILLPISAWFRAPPFSDVPRGRNLLIKLLYIFVVAPLLAALPFLMAGLTGGCPCGGEEGRFWLILQTYPSLILALALQQLVWRLKTAGAARLVIAFTGLAFYVVCALYVVGVIFLAPQKRISHFLTGFLHGPIYDAWIPLDTGIVLSRLSHLFMAVALLALAWWHRERKRTIAVIAALACWIGLAFWAHTYPSTTNDKRFLDRLLPHTLTHETFTLHYIDEESEAVRRIYRDAIFHVTELKEILGETASHVDVYVYPDRARMKLWFGGDQTDITDVVTPSIHITAEGYPHDTLRHELVHALTSEFAFFGLGAHPNIAFTEGIAVALAPTDRSLSLDEASAQLLQSGKVGDVSKLFSPLFWQESGSRAYTVAGSMVQYLIRHYGIEKVRRLYSGQSWNKVFGADREKVIEGWRQELQPLMESKEHSIQVNTLFRNPGVFYDLCPHAKATRRRGSDDWFTKVRQPPGWNAADDYWPWRLRLDPKDAYARLLYWQKRVKDSVEDPEKLRGLLSQLELQVNWPPENLEDVEMVLLLSDTHMLLGNLRESEKQLKDLLKLSRQQSIGDDLLRQVHARSRVADRLTGESRQSWLRYVSGFSGRKLPDSAYRQTDPWILTYLKLRQHPKAFRSEKVLRELFAITPPSNLPATFAIEWYKHIAYGADKLGLYQLAAAAYDQTAAAAPSGQKAVFEEHARRMEFFQREDLTKSEKAQP